MQTLRIKATTPVRKWIHSHGERTVLMQADPLFDMYVTEIEELKYEIGILCWVVSSIKASVLLF
jgi:hypothetical protein